jgi:hypothetical protein
MRTWDDNRTAINQLWPQCQWTEEERRLWKEDLSNLDQAVLYDALRNVKRTRDTLYPQLKWILDEYHQLSWARRRAAKQKTPTEKKLNITIDSEEDRRLHEDLVALIDMSEPADFDAVEERILDSLPKMHSRTALRCIGYARLRLLGQRPKFGRVTDDGDVEAYGIGGVA